MRTKVFGERNGDCVEVTTLRGVSGFMCLQPFEEVLEFRDRVARKVIVSKLEVGKSGGGITDEEILTAKQKAIKLLKAAALNHDVPQDVQENLRRHNKPIVFAGSSPPLLVDPQSIILRKP